MSAAILSDPTQDAPVWLDEIRQDVRRRVARSPFAPPCQRGEHEVVRRLLVRLWPFIDRFPKTVHNTCRELLRPRLLARFGVTRTVPSLWTAYRAVLRVKGDEKSHRDLWLEAADAMDLTPDELEQAPPIAEVREWIRAIQAEAEPSTRFARFAGIEIIAKAVCAQLLASHRFRAALGPRGCGWFRAHIQPPDVMTYEDILWQLAFAYCTGEPTRERFHPVVMGIADRFLDAIECAVARPRLPERLVRLVALRPVAA